MTGTQQGERGLCLLVQTRKGMGLDVRQICRKPAETCRCDASVASEDLEKLSAFFEEKIDPMDELPYRPGFV